MAETTTEQGRPKGFVYDDAFQVELVGEGLHEAVRVAREIIEAVGSVPGVRAVTGGGYPKARYLGERGSYERDVIPDA